MHNISESLKSLLQQSAHPEHMPDRVAPRVPVSLTRAATRPADLLASHPSLSRAGDDRHKGTVSHLRQASLADGAHRDDHRLGSQLARQLTQQSIDPQFVAEEDGTFASPSSEASPRSPGPGEPLLASTLSRALSSRPPPAAAIKDQPAAGARRLSGSRSNAAHAFRRASTLAAVLRPPHRTASAPTGRPALATARRPSVRRSASAQLAGGTQQ
eukprot:evm.model.scf_862.1 EVM.evm.TU.scf_862.1   scf_862:7424-8065(-)